MADAAENSPMGLGDKIEWLAELRDRKRDLNKQLQDLKEEYEAVEAEIMSDLDAQGLGFGGGSRHRATITESVVPSATDWDEFEDYCKENDALYLFERRISAKAWRELVESGEQVPGTEPFTRRSLSLRKI